MIDLKPEIIPDLRPCHLCFRWGYSLIIDLQKRGHVFSEYREEGVNLLYIKVSHAFRKFEEFMKSFKILNKIGYLEFLLFLIHIRLYPRDCLVCPSAEFLNE